ncbi:MAG TPA: minor capsid protein [Candidatus Hungatella pullicola]|nr:minor capsid protein [Candidatus Hungatella pullicola]
MSYWKKRQEAMYKAGEMQVNQYFTRLEKAFNQTKRELQKTIEAFYFRYAEENGLSYAAAQKRLDKEELGELQDFINLAMQNIGKYNQTVNNMSLKARITRYQALGVQVDAILRQLYALDYEAQAKETMQEVYEESYYRTWYSIDQYRGFHSNFAQVDPVTVQTLLEYPFNGAAFSIRLWKQKDHLQTQLMEAMTTIMIQGKHPSTLTAEFAKKMNSKKFDAYRLLHTESSFLMSEATHAGYKEDGVEKYQILAILDSKTCGICGDLDGNVYEVGKEVVGVNMPPFHPLCRCTDTPYYDDMDLSDITRVARDPETGKNYDVPGDMTYKEWHAQYIEQNPDKVLAEKKLRNKKADKAQFKRYQQILGKDAPKTLDSFQKLKYTDGSGWKSLQRDYRDASCYEKIISDAGKLNIKGKPLKKINRIDLTDYTFMESHINRTREHGVTKDQAQTWVNDSIAAYSRWNGEVTVYISRSGAVVVNLKEKTISTAYSAEEYDDKFTQLLEVLKND